MQLAQPRNADVLSPEGLMIFTGDANPKLAADTFRFTPPAGADVIGEPTEAAEAIPRQ